MVLSFALVSTAWTRGGGKNATVVSKEKKIV